MRITNSMIMGQYANQLNQNVERVSDDTQKLSSGQMYSRASQDPVDAAEMIAANGQLNTIERYQKNITNTQAWLTDTESTVNKTYYSILQSANTTLNAAANSGTDSSVNNSTLATNLQYDQTEILSALNSTSSTGQYVFGGSASGNPPFKAGSESDYTAYSNYVTAYKNVYETAYNGTTGTAADKQSAAEAAITADSADGSTALGAASSALTVAPVVDVTIDGSGNATVSAALSESDIEGKLLYQTPGTGKYIPVAKINDSAQTSSTTVNDLAYYSTENSAMTRSYPVDLGYGTQMDSSGNVAAGTAFEASTDPLSFLLQNVTASGSQNVYDNFGATATALNNDDTSTVSASQTLNTQSMDAASLTNAVLGAKQNMLTFLSNKYSADNTNATQRLSNVEDVDTTTAYTQYSLHLMAYQATLAISNSILQNNLTEYLK
ncbi:hypothetical protein [Ethanoligenens harbinense]|uniref:Uncharacterized protein n=1 Tax=Ethanoligenens harbinense (strain DSM 18485 / JCM 12961 / CGMCC 1.5033 / YUAN-3) TaxID=663278 RepID=E6U6H5_ETHHY|nr:hypothetical protein [Ethanoligenens harbinense]ADU28045.1 hypothetical protein Ethha_2552 [Ethanoligenens harbinense YUAN-3]AVQ97062.1 hypothetical protein CXQ68_13110 [Ethanoligenens harbinense YUAN-3]AYF39724.1 hypothetical protein CXP51_13010 [Ethanoligenens harbinense]AYF42557.1 hypothetical protein CN246_13590 [Ethanoligenens harbinense]QCN93305.1 hypothetical protein DRA42_13160 [Ethanoligenens harbinense]